MKVHLSAFLYVLIALGSSIARADSSPDRIGWQQVDDDLEWSHIVMPIHMFFATRIDLFRTSLSKHRIVVLRSSEYGEKRSDAKTLCKLSRSTLCINANFFDEQGKALGLIIDRGITLQKVHRGGDTLTGIFEVTRNSRSIVNRLDFKPERAVEAIQAGPRLVVGGQPVVGLRESSPATRRSGICIDADNRVIFFVIESSVFGLPIERLQKLLLHRDIACWDALNLDGGSSTQLYVASPDSGSPVLNFEQSILGEDDVPVMLAISPID